MELPRRMVPPQLAESFTTLQSSSITAWRGEKIRSQDGQDTAFGPFGRLGKRETAAVSS
jgi:hypothetical protein